MLDQIRDVVLHKKGNETLTLAGSESNETNNGSAELVNFFNDIINSQAKKLGGMLLKTYDSDIFNNWIKTDWILKRAGLLKRSDSGHHAKKSRKENQVGLAV